MPKPLYNVGTDCIVQMDKGSAAAALCQRIITESAECPDFGTIIGAVNARCYVAAIRTIVGISTEYPRITGTGLMAFGIIVVIPTKQARITMSGLMPLGIIMVIASEETRV